MTPIDSQLHFYIEDRINDIVQNVLGDFIDAGIVQVLNDIVGQIESSDENGLREAHTDKVVAEIMESMSPVVCGDALMSSGDAPSAELQSVESTATSEDVPADNGKEVFNTFGELVGWLDPGATPVQRAPRRQNLFSATWRRVRRVVPELLGFRG